MQRTAFICVHDSSRSQIAEALGRRFAGDAFESYPVGTEKKPRIDQDAVRLMREIYGVDMEAEGQRSKPVCDIPDPDTAISMGCNVGCPFIGRPFDDNGGGEGSDGKEQRGISQGHCRNRVAGKGAGGHREGACLVSGYLTALCINSDRSF